MVLFLFPTSLSFIFMFFLFIVYFVVLFMMMMCVCVSRGGTQVTDTYGGQRTTLWRQIFSIHLHASSREWTRHRLSWPVVKDLYPDSSCWPFSSPFKDPLGLIKMAWLSVGEETWAIYTTEDAVIPFSQQAPPMGLQGGVGCQEPLSRLWYEVVYSILWG